jgi:Arc/MetJ family transcription regulator
VGVVRITIVVDDRLLADALRATGLSSTRQVIEQGLKLVVRLKGQERILGLAGKVHWEGELNRR